MLNSREYLPHLHTSQQSDKEELLHNSVGRGRRGGKGLKSHFKARRLQNIRLLNETDPGKVFTLRNRALSSHDLSGSEEMRTE